MGQYYKAVNIDKKEYVRPHAYDNGAKLLEHSYIKNDFLGVVTTLLKKEWKGDRVIWLGDYFEKDENPAVPLDWESTENYDQLTPPATTVKKGFLNNLTKKISIDLSKVKATYDIEEDGYVMHPLAILTVCGNGRGGGDINDENHYLYKLAGTWAGDNLSVTDKPQFKTSLFFNNVTQSVEFITEEETETMGTEAKTVKKATKQINGGTRMATLKKATKKSAPKAKATRKVAKKAPAKRAKIVKKATKKSPAKNAKATKILAKVKATTKKVAKKAKTVRKATAKRATKKDPLAAALLASSKLVVI